MYCFKCVSNYYMYGSANRKSTRLQAISFCDITWSFTITTASAFTDFPHYAAAADDTTASESTVTGHAIREQQEKTQVADVTAGQAETVLDVMEQESKLRWAEKRLTCISFLCILVSVWSTGGHVLLHLEYTVNNCYVSFVGNMIGLGSKVCWSLVFLQLRLPPLR